MDQQSEGSLPFTNHKISTNLVNEIKTKTKESLGNIGGKNLARNLMWYKTNYKKKKDCVKITKEYKLVLNFV